MQIQAQAALRRRLAPPELGPVHGIGHQPDRRRIDGVVDGVDEALRQSALALLRRAESRRLLLQLLGHAPEQLPGHVRVAGAVGVRERVARRWRRPTHRRQRPAVNLQAVAYIVQRGGAAQLCMDQRHHMTPHAEAACLLVDAVDTGNLVDQMQRNELAQLPQSVQTWP